MPKNILQKYKHNNNKSKNGAIKNRRGSGTAIRPLQDENAVEKFERATENTKQRKQKEERYKVQERERATATRFDLAQGSHQAVEQVRK